MRTRACVCVRRWLVADMLFGASGLLVLLVLLVIVTNAAAAAGQPHPTPHPLCFLAGGAAAGLGVQAAVEPHA